MSTSAQASRRDSLARQSLGISPAAGTFGPNWQTSGTSRLLFACVPQACMSYAQGEGAQET